MVGSTIIKPVKLFQITNSLTNYIVNDKAQKTSQRVYAAGNAVGGRDYRDHRQRGFARLFTWPTL